MKLVRSSKHSGNCAKNSARFDSICLYFDRFRSVPFVVFEYFMETNVRKAAIQWLENGVDKAQIKKSREERKETKPRTGLDQTHYAY